MESERLQSGMPANSLLRPDASLSNLFRIAFYGAIGATILTVLIPLMIVLVGAVWSIGRESGLQVTPEDWRVGPSWDGRSLAAIGIAMLLISLAANFVLCCGALLILWVGGRGKWSDRGQSWVISGLLSVTVCSGGLWLAGYRGNGVVLLVFVQPLAALIMRRLLFWKSACSPS